MDVIMEFEILTWVKSAWGIAGVAIFLLAIVRFFGWLRDRVLPKCSGEKVTILVAEISDAQPGILGLLARGWKAFGIHLSAPKANAATQLIIDTLDRELDALLGGIEVHVVRRKLSVDRFGDRTKNWIETIKKGRGWLNKANADLLIWGEASAADTKKIRLHFLGSHSDPEGRFIEIDTSEAFDASFGEGMSVALAAQVLAQLAPVLARLTNEPAKILIPFAKKIEALLQKPPANLTKDALNQLQFLLAILASHIGGQAQDSKWLKKSADVYNLILKRSTKLVDPALWAAAQINLGSALAMIGSRLGIEKLGAAVTAFERALEVYSRETFPLDWALTQNNLGNVLQMLGNRLEPKEGITKLKAAINVYNAALEVRTRESLPLDWATTQHNLAAAFLELGARLHGHEGIESVEAAVASFECSLAVRSHKLLPLDWAMTHNNLGNALLELGKRLEDQDGVNKLEKAIAAYNLAFKVHKQEVLPMEWAMTQNNLGNALLELGARAEGQGGIEKLENAAAAFKSSLEVYTQKNLPVLWATSQNNLGSALGSLTSQLEGQCAVESIEAAIDAFECSLKVRTRNALPLDWAATNQNLGNALLQLMARDERKITIDHLRAALVAFESALEIFTVGSFPIRHEDISIKIRDLNAVLDERLN